MIRVNALIKSNTYRNFINQNQFWESDRKFCRHGFNHMLDVARIAYIYLLEKEAIELTKEIIYAAGLLHDVGRWVQYQTGEDHALASARLAQPLLLDYGFSEAETSIIIEAIKEHRNKSDKDIVDDGLNLLEERNPLVKAMALADDWSRDCLNCQAKSECYKTQLISDWTLKF